MSLGKLSAGGGYTYLTRQVAAHDETHRGRDGLATYYSQRGESPGVWLGSAATGLHDFPAAGEVVTEAQMLALFGEGRHPNADGIEARTVHQGHLVRQALAATKLGAAYRTEAAVGDFGLRLARAYEQWKDASGQVKSAAVPEPVRARLRTDLTRQMFAERHGREPTSGSELAGFAARVSRRPGVPVAGYDLTFTPVKSVSALWAVAPPRIAQVVEQAHADACADVLAWLERRAGYTRLGRDGVRQVQVRGLLAVAFTHRDSRAGDPNLHTHVAVSNKVQTLDGRWRALDGRPLHALATAASERYNTRLEALLIDRLGFTFADRPGTPSGKRPVREAVGVDSGLLELWSSRRAAIDTRRSELAARFTAEHSRPPTPVEAIKLAQQATLETRQAKHQPRSYAEQRATWRADAEQALGGPRQVEAMLETLPTSRTNPRRPAEPISPAWVADGAQAVLDVVQAGRATWREAHVRAEAERLVRTRGVPLAQLDDAVERLVAAALSPALSVPLGPPDPDASAGPAALRRDDGTSLHTVAGSRLFTSAQVLAAEQQLLQLAARTDGRAVSAGTVDCAVGQATEDALVLNGGQTAMIRELATSGRRVQLALAPAGTGKTTALRALAAAWTADGGTVLGLAPSAAAAAVLAAGLADGDGPRVPADTLAKLLWSMDHLDEPDRRVPRWVRQVGPGTLVLIDEAGMAGTLDLARVVTWVIERGGSVRLVGDNAQLAAVGAGGVLRDLARTHGAAGLHDVVRFIDLAEGPASLALRDGDPVALGFYVDRQRVHLGDPDGAVEQAYTAWAADRSAGRDSVLLAPTRELVGELNHRAREDRLKDAGANGDPVGREVRLADGSSASAGDRILTRRNDRRLVLSPTDWVKNGDRWTVTAVLPGGAVQAVHTATARRVLLPAAYVAQHVALGYASTIHTAQGSTADTSHTVLTGREDRQLLYVAATRGRTANHLYLQGAVPGEEHDPPGGDLLRPPTPAETLTRVLARDGAQTSATSTERALQDPAALLGVAVARYVDSLAVAQRQEAVVGLPASVRSGPLPWLQAVPTAIAADPVWGPHLQAQAERVRDLARQVDDRAGTWTVGSAPTWAAPLLATGSTHADLTGRLAVWRAAQQVPDEDRRLTGPPARQPAELRVQDDLFARASSRVVEPGVGVGWRRQLDALAPSLRRDPDWSRLTQCLDAAAAVGHDLELLVQRAVEQAPLPDELPAAALLWRLVPHLPQPEPRTLPEPTRPKAAAAVDPEAPIPARVRWRPLADAIDPRLAACPNWPLLAGALDRAERAGHDVATRLPVLAAQAPLDEDRPAHALTGRLVEECPAAGLQLSAAAWAADDRRRRVQALRSVGTTAPTHGPTATTRTPAR
jgi:conjugative relaxase-like TrwC/TraI family protein